MYVSAITERMRKRKAFADSELDSTSPHLLTLQAPDTTPAPTTSTTHLLPISSSFQSNAAFYTTTSSSSLSNTLSPYSHYLMPLSIHTSGINEINIGNYVSTQPIENYQTNDAYLSCLSSPTLPQPPQQTAVSPSNLRIIDDARYTFTNVNDAGQMDRMSPICVHSSPSVDGSIDDNHNNNRKPKLSFSIESIIGIK